MLKDLLTLLLLSLSVVVWCTGWSASLPPLFSRVDCWLVLQCLLSVSLYRVWSPAVTSVVQPGPHVLHPSDTFPACLSSGQSSLVLEWHRIRDLDKISFRHLKLHPWKMKYLSNAAMKVIKKTTPVYFSAWNYVTRLTWVCWEGLMPMKPNFTLPWALVVSLRVVLVPGEHGQLLGAVIVAAGWIAVTAIPLVPASPLHPPSSRCAGFPPLVGVSLRHGCQHVRMWVQRDLRNQHTPPSRPEA